MFVTATVDSSPLEFLMRQSIVSPTSVDALSSGQVMSTGLSLTLRTLSESVSSISPDSGPESHPAMAATKRIAERKLAASRIGR